MVYVMDKNWDPQFQDKRIKTRNNSLCHPLEYELVQFVNSVQRRSTLGREV